MKEISLSAEPCKVLLKGYPVCSKHGAMNKVSKDGMWRCLMCHVGFDESRAYLKDSQEGFKQHGFGGAFATEPTGSTDKSPKGGVGDAKP